MCRECAGNVQVNKKCTENVHDVHRRHVQEMCKKCTGNVQEIYRKCTGNGRKFTHVYGTKHKKVNLLFGFG